MTSSIRATKGTLTKFLYLNKCLLISKKHHLPNPSIWALHFIGPNIDPCISTIFTTFLSVRPTGILIAMCASCFPYISRTEFDILFATSNKSVFVSLTHIESKALGYIIQSNIYRMCFLLLH